MALEFLNLSNDSFPVNFPGSTFYPDKNWLLRFAEADFPVINYGLGITIDFNKNNEPETYSILTQE